MKSICWESGGSPLAKRFWDTGTTGFPIYDMHGHMGTNYAIFQPYCEAPEMVAHMNEAGVRRLVFTHTHVLLGDMRNSQCVEICRRYPDRLRMYLGIVPRYPENIREDLANFDRWRPFCAGLKFLPDYYRIPATDRRWEYALKWADERGVPCLFHTWGESPYDGGRIMLELVHRYENIKFFMGHGIYREWEYSERVVRESPRGNVWLELTAIPGDRGHIEELTARVGSDRLLFGTDMPWFDYFQAIGGVLSAKISDADKKNILCDNVERLFGADF